LQSKGVNPGLPAIHFFLSSVLGRGCLDELVRFAMDFDKLMEKVSKWFSDPGAREVIKSLIYVLLPLIVFSLIRNIKRAQAAKKEDTAITPRIRGSSTEGLVSTETLRETMAREKKKVARELQEVFGRRERSLTRPRAGEAFPSQVPAEEPMPESPGPGDDQAPREDLRRILFGRRRQ
jgi:hypothetical protein